MSILRYLKCGAIQDEEIERLEQVVKEQRETIEWYSKALSDARLMEKAYRDALVTLSNDDNPNSGCDGIGTAHVHTRAGWDESMRGRNKHMRIGTVPDMKADGR